MPEGKLIAVQGATISCPNSQVLGMPTSNILISTSDIQTCCCSDSILTINDDGVGTNIRSFQGCSLTSNKRCRPTPLGGWRKSAEPFADIQEEILTEDSYFVCAIGMNIVKISDPGQEDLRVGDEFACENSEFHAFIEAAEEAFGPLSDEQLANVEAIIDAFIAFGDQDPAKLAYILSTSNHESQFSTIREGDHVPAWRNHTDAERAASLQRFYINDPRLRAQRFNEPHPITGQYYFGRGFVQITHDFNYENYTDILTNHYGESIDLMNNPELVMNPEYAALIMVHGMMNGEFTGAGLDTYINESQQNFTGARATVGGVAEPHYASSATNVLQEYQEIIDGPLS